jgi:hypothetical protein
MEEKKESVAIPVVLPSTDSHIIRGSDNYEVLAFPSANILGFRNDYFEIEIDNYGENWLGIRPQRIIYINYDGKIVSDKVHSGIGDQWIEKVDNGTGYTEDIGDENLQYEDNRVRKQDKNLISPHMTFNNEILKSLEAVESQPIEFQLDSPILLKDCDILGYTNLDVFPEIKDVKVRDFRRVRTDDFTLTQISGVLYILSQNTTGDSGVIIKVLYCPEYDMQDGDCHTYFYLLNEQSFLVYNDGDVYSVLLFVPSDFEL